MNRIWIMASVIVAGVALSACGKDQGGRSGTSEVTVTRQVNGMEPNAYFRQFLYKVDGSCERSMAYYFPKSETQKIGVNFMNQDVLAEVSILMNENHTFQAFYQEIDVYKYINGGSGYQWARSREMILKGKWQVKEDRLELEGLGYAAALQYNGRPAMQLRMSSDLISKGLRDRVLLVRRVGASYNPITELDPCAR